MAEEKQVELNNKQLNEHSYEINTTLSSFDTIYYNAITLGIRPETVKQWLNNHVAHYKQIISLSNRLYNSNGIYTNTVDYMVALPTLDRVIWCENKNHTRVKKNKELFNEALRKIKDRLTTRDNLHKLAVDGTAFYYFEVTESPDLPKFLSDIDVEQMTEINTSSFNCSLLPLPTDYCRIVGRKNSSYVVAFDMSYFDQFISRGLSLKLKRYPKEIRDGYKRYRKDLNARWAVLDNDKTVTTKVRAKIEERVGRPIALASFIDMLYDAYFIDTKRSILDEINTSVVYQTFPEGEKKGTSSLTKKQQEDQHNNIKNALFTRGVSKGTNFLSVAAGTKLNKIETNVEFLKVKAEDELIKRISTGLGFAGALLNGEGGDYSSTQSNIEMIASELFSWLEMIQDELNKVINANVIKDKQTYIQLYYLPITHANRKEKVAEMKDLYSNGGSLLAWVASTGFSSDAYVSLMDFERAEGFDKKYPPHLTSHQMSGKQNNQSGRPEETNPTNPNTIKSKTNGSNNNPN